MALATPGCWLPVAECVKPHAAAVRACRFYDTCMSLNGQPNRCYTGQYQTDLLRDKALDIIRCVRVYVNGGLQALGTCSYPRVA